MPPPDTTLAADTTTPGTVVQTPPRIPPAGNSPPDTTPVVRRPDTTVVAVSSEPGFVDLSCRPWASVYLGDSLVGTTPLPGVLTLPPGRHNLVLLNPEIGLPISRTVTVVGGKTTELHINLYEFVARIRIASVKPWADVYVNGKLELRTPSSKLIFRPLGTYQVTLKNPDFPDYTETLVFREADPIHEIRVDLAQRQATP